MSPPKGHTTLSDLLADDVRDYFLREGVSDSQTPTPTRTRSARYSSRKKRSQNSNNLSKSAAAFVPLSSTESPTPTTSSSSGGSLRSGWTNTPSSTSSCSKSPSPINGKLGNNNSIKMKSLGGNNNKEKQSYESMQHQQQQSTRKEEQIRGQNTAEYHSIDDNNTNSLSNNRPNNLQQEHRRHSSGSGSFHSHHSRGSRGSASSRSKHVSAADAEFLRRYSEEKERTNMRMAAARPNLKSNEIAEARVPFDPIAIALDKRPYHSIIQSPRPPTVTGSHRPGLPSIDNDDWEEDDRIERRDKRKMERKEARKLERHRRMDSATPSAVTVLDSPRSHSITNRDRASSTGADSGAPSMGSVVYHKSPGQPYNGLTRMTSQGSIMSTGSVGFTPGTNESMSYSAESSQNYNAAGLPPELPYSNNHSRRDSMESFIRKASSGSNMGIDENGRARQGSYPQQETILSENDKPRPTRHVRPLSYLSASSDSDGKGGEQREGSYPTIKEESGLRPSPHSSSSGTYGHLQIPDYTRFSSTDGSDLNSALLGSAILGSSAASQESTRFAKVKQPGHASDYRRQRFDDDDESSGSYDSDSDESSYTTSDSYDGDSSSQSHTSSEQQQQHRLRVRTPQHAGYQNYNNNRVKWESVHFDRNRDLEAPFNERDRLRVGRNGATNYSSIETKTKQKQNRYKPSPGKPRLGGPNSVPLRLDDAIDVLLGKFNKVFVMLELFISNMPSLVGSLALAWCSLGVDWFKVSYCRLSVYHYIYVSCIIGAYSDLQLIVHLIEFSGTKKLLMPVIQHIITIKGECEERRLSYPLISLPVSSLTFSFHSLLYHIISDVSSMSSRGASPVKQTRMATSSFYTSIISAAR